MSKKTKREETPTTPHDLLRATIKMHSDKVEEVLCAALTEGQARRIAEELIGRELARVLKEKPL